MESKRKASVFDEREKILLGADTADEEMVLNLSLRPQKFEDFIGQKKVIENLKISLQAARKREEVLEHIIFSGPPGLGKTTLAHIIGSELGAKITATSGPAIERAGDLIGILTNLGKGDILFIDEIHRISKVVEEFLYPAMENFQIDFVIDKGPYAKTIKFNLKPFTLIGATTRTGLLSAPMRGRFGMLYHLDFYEPEDLITIIKRSAKILNVDIDDEGALEIAMRSRGTPRIANRLLRRVRDYAEVKKDGKITKEVADEALCLQGVDKEGLDNMDRKILKTVIEVYKGGPVGIEALAATLNEEKDTISDVIEPFLLKIGMIKRSPRGRLVTEKSLPALRLKVRQERKRTFLIMKILIHTCCAPCLIYPHKRLKEKGFCVESFYYNPNIHPREEYLKRKQQVENYTKEEGIKMREARYEIKEFFRQVNQNEDPPLRCNLCWQLRLGETAKFAKENGFEIFTTTLLVSPYQDHQTLKETGEECAEKYGVKFYYEDFRKGYQESVVESKKRNMYRQKYCGCLYSMERNKK